MKLLNRWFDPRSKSTGMLAFSLHRLTGLGLVLYLYLHLAVLNSLRQGPQAWDGFISLMRSPVFIGLDALLLFGILMHGLNGLRLVLLGLGLGLNWQRQAYLVCLFFSLALTILGILAMK
jgi:succinate dehydrogenase / fumarate reductase, cytochrome b subunit